MLWRHTGAAEVQLHSFLTVALDGGEWLTSRSGHFTIGKKPCAHRTGGLVDPRVNLYILEMGIISCPFTGENQSTHRKIYPSATSSNTNPTWLPWDWKQEFMATVQKLTALSHGTYWYSITKQPNNWATIYSCISVILHENTHLPGSRSGYPIVWPQASLFNGSFHRSPGLNTPLISSHGLEHQRT